MPLSSRFTALSRSRRPRIPFRPQSSSKRLQTAFKRKLPSTASMHSASALSFRRSASPTAARARGRPVLPRARDRNRLSFRSNNRHNKILLCTSDAVIPRPTPPPAQSLLPPPAPLIAPAGAHDSADRGVRRAEKNKKKTRRDRSRREGVSSARPRLLLRLQSAPCTAVMYSSTIATATGEGGSSSSPSVRHRLTRLTNDSRNSRRSAYGP